MAASKIFTNLIRNIESSELNYTMTKTPFSAIISLRSSFVKRHGEEERCPEVETVKHSPSEDLKHLESEVEKLELRNLSLKAELKNHQDSSQKQQDKFEKETLKLQIIYNTEKGKSEGLEKQIGELRDEVLKIKLEKNKLKGDIKTEMEMNATLKEECKDLKERNASLIKLEKNKVDLLSVKNAQLKCANEENEELKQVLAKTKVEVEALKIKDQFESKMKYTCEECDMSVETSNQLRVHIRCYHTHSKSSQYEKEQTFEVYPCFYCDYPLTCSGELEAHETNCTVFGEILQSENTIQDINFFPCAQCSFLSASMEELLTHMNNNHSDNVTEQFSNEELYSCDFCGITFGTLGGLRNHIRSLHKEMLPT